MASYVAVELLKPHPKNAEYFSDPAPEEYDALKRSIAAQGVRDPLKVLPDYTVLAGHLRLRVARDLGLEKVPVEVWDVPPEEAEYLLVADNEERRVCQDPVKKAKRAEFLARYWDVREGRTNPKGSTVAPREGQNVPHERKTLADVAEALGESEKSIKRLLKLNDLTPSLQHLVSQGKLGQTAAYSLAFLPPDEQEELLDALGESGVCGLSVAQAKEMRAALEDARRVGAEMARRLAEAEAALAEAQEGSAEAERLKAEMDALQKENAELKSRGPETVEKVVEKVVYRADPETALERDAARAEVDRLTKELDYAEARLKEALADGERGRAKAKRLEEEAGRLRRMLETAQKEMRRKEDASPDPGHRDLRAIFEKATNLAAELAGALDTLASRRRAELTDMAWGEDAANAADKVAFQALTIALGAAERGIREVKAVLEEKPKLTLIKGESNHGDKN